MNIGIVGGGPAGLYYVFDKIAGLAIRSGRNFASPIFPLRISQ
jgi:hypothetical protein